MNPSLSTGMSSLTLSILIFAVLVALGVGAHSFWVLRRENKKLAQLSPKETEPQAPGKASTFGVSRDQSPSENRTEPHVVSAVSGGAGSVLPAGDFSNSALEVQNGANRGPEIEQAQAKDVDMTGEAVPVPPRTSAPSSLSDDLQGDLLAPQEQIAMATGKESGAEIVSNTPSSEVPVESVGTVTGGSGELIPNLREDAIPSGSRVLHDEADCLIPIALQQPSSGDRLIGLTKSIRRAGGKPVAFEGCTNGTWEGLRYGASYQSLRAGILLSNRQGPLNAMEFSELSSKLLGLGAQLGVAIEMPEMNTILQRARSLDSMLAECDVQLGLAVDCSRALSTVDLATLARRIGLHERGNNRYALLSDQAELIYSVALGDKAQRLQLMFDVPRVLPEYKPWWKMAEAAHQASILFDGKITDDSGRELSEQSFKHVAIALEGRQQALAEAGVPAGSALALRVFN